MIMIKMYVFFIKLFLCCILFLIMAILCKGNYISKDYIYEIIYKDNFNFSNFNKFYNNYFGGIFPIEFISDNISEVFHEELNYNQLDIYEEGVVLDVNFQYLVPSLEDGIVLYVGEKDKYNHVVIIQNKDGVDFWYGNFCNIDVKLYDMVNSGTYLGEVCDNKLYLVFSRGNDFLKYDNFLS